MSWVAVAIGGSAVIGGAVSMSAADKQAGAGKDAINQMAGTYNMNKMELDPWRNTGVQGLGALQQGLGIGTGFGGPDGYTMGGFNPNAPLMKGFGLDEFQQSPAYQFNLQQGQMAIDKSANARGNFFAPQTLQDIGKFSQGLASNEFQNAFNNYNTSQNNMFSRLMGMSNNGLSGASALAGVSNDMSKAIGGVQQGVGNSQAAGIMGMGNAAQGGLGDLAQLYMQRQAMQNNQPIMGGGGGFGA